MYTPALRCVGLVDCVVGHRSVDTPTLPIRVLYSSPFSVTAPDQDGSWRDMRRVPAPRFVPSLQLSIESET